MSQPMSTKPVDPRLIASYYLEEDYQGPEAPVTFVAQALLDAVNEIDRLRTKLKEIYIQTDPCNVEVVIENATTQLAEHFDVVHDLAELAFNGKAVADETR